MAQEQKHNIYGGKKYLLQDKNGNKYRLEVDTDCNPESPRIWDNVGTMILYWGKHNLGDDHQGKSKDEWLEIYKQYMAVSREPNPQVAILPLYVYEHGGITISTNDFGDRWDSGRAGFIFVDKATYLEKCGSGGIINENSWHEHAIKSLNAEVKIYRQYLEGNVYSYWLEKEITIEEKCPHCGQVIEATKEWAHVDSCGGFYGETLEDSCILDYIPKGLEIIGEYNDDDE